VIPFSAGELTLDRAPFTADLPDTCVIHRWSNSGDTAGGWGDTWTPEGSSVACRIAPSGMRAVEQPVAGRVGVVEFYTGTFASTVLLGARDRVVPSTGDFAGLTFEAVGEGLRSRVLSRRVPLVRAG
jgi:hypothetical protein